VMPGSCNRTRKQQSASGSRPASRPAPISLIVVLFPPRKCASSARADRLHGQRLCLCLRVIPLFDKERTMRRLTCIILLVSAFALAVATPSYAEGGSSIAAAPSIVSGQQEFGNTAAHGATGHDSCGEPTGYQSWWTLAVTAGDKVTVNWEAQLPVYTELVIYPIGTTDFNFPKTQTLLRQQLNSNGKNEAMLTAATSGDLPVLVTTGAVGCFAPTPGPYALTVYITHALNVALPWVGALHKTGTLTVGVHNPEGGAVSDPALQVELQIDVHGSWDTIGVAVVANSAAVVHYKLPARFRRQRVSIRAVAHGPEYKSTDSSHLKVRTL
jgi:hypothetical protein